MLLGYIRTGMTCFISSKGFDCHLIATCCIYQYPFRGSGFEDRFQLQNHKFFEFSLFLKVLYFVSLNIPYLLISRVLQLYTIEPTVEKNRIFESLRDLCTQFSILLYLAKTFKQDRTPDQFLHCYRPHGTVSLIFVTLRAKMAPPDFQRYPRKLCLMKYE